MLGINTDIPKVDMERNPKRVENIMNWIIYGNFEAWVEKNKQRILERKNKNYENTK